MTVPVPTGAFGTSIALAQGDFSLVNGDLALISGRDNFAQALRVIIDTPFGSDPVNVGYGFDVAAIFTTANTVRAIKDVIRLNLVKSLAADDRVQEIAAIVFDDEPKFGSLAPEFASPDAGARARRSRGWHAVVTFTTVHGGQQRIAVSGGMP
jgi:hypothetical protein